MSSFTLATLFINIVFSVNIKGAWGFRKNTAGLMRNIEECFVLDFEQHTLSEGSFYQSVFSVSSAVCTRIERNGFLCIYSGHTFSPFLAVLLVKSLSQHALDTFREVYLSSL